MEFGEGQAILADYARRKPKNVVLQQEGLLLVWVAKQVDLLKQLKVWRHENLFSALHIAVDDTTKTITVFYEMSWAGAPGKKEAVHARELLQGKPHNALAGWLQQEYAPKNIHDLLHAGAEEREAHLEQALANTLELFNQMKESPERNAMASAMMGKLLRMLTPQQAIRAKQWVVQRKMFSLFLIPEKQRTVELCDSAMTNYFANVRYVPVQMLCDGLYEKHATGKPDAFALAGPAALDEKLLRIAIAAHPKTLLYTPFSRLDQDLLHHAFALHPEAVGYLPESLLTEELCRKAVQQQQRALEHLPPHCLTRAVLEEAQKHSSNFFHLVPWAYRTEELCRMAMEIEPASAPWIPQPFVLSSKPKKRGENHG